MNQKEKIFRHGVAGRDLIFSIGQFAGQADASVTVRYGDTVVLGTCLMGDPKPEKNFMPLLVEYEEKFYAAGKIKGSRFVKREGRPTDLAITTGRLIDRSIRPLFPDGLRNDNQVVATVFSYDDENEADVVALIAASAALAISKIPWNGPLGAVRVGRRDGQFILNPTAADRFGSDLDLVVAATEREAVMLEADAQELPEETILEAIAFGTKAASEIAAAIAGIAKSVGAEKVLGVYAPPPDAGVSALRETLRPEVEAALEGVGSKLDFNRRVETVADRAVSAHAELPAEQIRALCHVLYSEVVREWILDKGKRVGGRAVDEVRPLMSEVSVLPRTHGSALFQRGETQILSVVTLGAPDDVLILDTMTEEDTKKRFFHFYNMPGFSVGEIKPNRGPSRRDIGHGMLAERAVRRLIPGRDVFPYTVMVVSEVLSSNGSSSMGSACGASLALMDAGVPIPRAVAGIAMGLVTDESPKRRKPVVLTDIAGMEDEGCDMDFKVAGTRQGVTALQVDIKVRGISPAIIQEAVLGARVAREHILDSMTRTLAAPRPELSPYAPRIVSFMIKPEKIRDVIGPRGSVINKIIEETGVDILVEDSGQVSITGTDAAKLQRAVDWVKSLTKEATVGEAFSGRVTRLMKFGAFVELFPGTEGLVHISEFGQGFVRAIEDVAAVGDILQVVVKEIDELGRVNLSLNRPRDTQSETPGGGSESPDLGALGRGRGPSGGGRDRGFRGRSHGGGRAPRPPAAPRWPTRFGE